MNAQNNSNILNPFGTPNYQSPDRSESRRGFIALYLTIPTKCPPELIFRNNKLVFRNLLLAFGTLNFSQSVLSAFPAQKFTVIFERLFPLRAGNGRFATSTIAIAHY
jgi:hypothetical protein